MDTKRVIEIFSPYLKELGFVKGSKKGMWFKDCGFYLIAVETQPYMEIGFFLGVAVKFLWSGKDYVTFDYYNVSYNDDHRIYPKIDPSPMGAVLFESKNLERELKYLFFELNRRICEYEELTDLNLLLKNLKIQYEYCKIVKPQFADIADLGVVKIMTGDFDGGMFDFRMISEKSDEIKKLLSCEDKNKFHAKLLQIINETRKHISSSQKIKLKEISSIIP